MVQTTELHSQTLASLKPKISQALDNLLDEIHTSSESKVLRTAFKKSTHLQKSTFQDSKFPRPSCPLCKEAGRKHHHYLSQCKFLPQSDKQYLNKVHQTSDYTDQISDQDCSEYEDNDNLKDNSIYLCSSNIHLDVHLATSRRVCTKQSPYLKVFYEHQPVIVTLDSGAKISMIKASSTASLIGASIKKSNQSALQADGGNSTKYYRRDRCCSF